jgi:uncharacterized cofD-like protein
MIKKKSWWQPFKLRRMFLPTAKLYQHAAGASFGLVVFLVGAVLSFRMAFQPFLRQIAEGWNALIGGLIHQENVADTNHVLGGLLLVVGIILQYRCARAFVRSIVEVLNPSAKGGVANSFVRKQQLALGPRIVAIGGGTGLSTMLRGLKMHSSNITAIVTVTDDGGSSGRLVREMGMIPPGDMRNCLVALADAEKLMTDLFQHRFSKKGGPLSGHSLGNLLIAGFLDQANGDMDRALELASDVLAIRGRVIPSTKDHVRLRALLESGVEICGETAIVSSGERVRRLYIDPEDVTPHQAAIEAIKDAELIVIGPGSVFTSIIPNLLVPGIAEAISAAECVKAYICNVMTQPGETQAFTAAEHMVAIHANVGPRICDYVLVNTGMPTDYILERYRESAQDIVEPDVDRLHHMGYKAITGNFMSETDFVRHDPSRLAARLMEVLNR